MHPRLDEPSEVTDLPDEACGAAAAHAPAPPTHSPDGVDLTLIRWTLGLTPRQRLDLLQAWVDGLAELRDGRPGR